MLKQDGKAGKKNIANLANSLVKIKNRYKTSIPKRIQENENIGYNFIIQEDIEKMFQEALKEILRYEED
jgi:hypothetical protein